METYTVSCSWPLERRLRENRMDFSLHVEADSLSEGDVREILQDILADIHDYVRDGDAIEIYDAMDMGEMVYRFPLKVSDRYLGEFERSGYTLEGSRIDREGDMPQVSVRVRPKNGVERDLCILDWVTVGDEGEAYLNSMIKKTCEGETSTTN